MSASLPKLQLLTPNDRRKTKILGLDPGETTGVCILNGCDKDAATFLQWKTKDLRAFAWEFWQFLEKEEPQEIACEDYRVYGWKAEDHAWAELHTAKLVGSIIAVTALLQIPLTLRMAVEAKTMITDDKLKAWGMYDKSQKHARDATRHALYHLLFPKKAR